MRDYLIPTETIDSDSPLVRSKAFSLCEGKMNDKEKARALFYFVRDEIKYRIALFQKMDKEKFKASLTLKQGYGFCVTKAILLIALCRAVGIPSRLHFSDIRNFLIPKALKEFIGTDILAFHGYADLFVQERWIKVNPAFDKELCQENGFIPVEFTGDQDALSHRYDRKGRPHIEYVRDRGSFSDLPLEMLLAGLKEYYGVLDERKMARWNQGYYNLSRESLFKDEKRGRE
jgi:transglutaminase-like putative cysteine protease